MKYVKDKARLTYVVEFFKALLFDKVSFYRPSLSFLGFNYMQR